MPLPKTTDDILKKLKNKFNRKDNNTETLGKQSDEMWRIGIICRKDCYYITTEILKCLERNGYEWKIISSSYKIKCRKKKIDPQEDTSKALNVLIQIFNVSVEVDFVLEY